MNESGSLINAYSTKGRQPASIMSGEDTVAAKRRRRKAQQGQGGAPRPGPPKSSEKAKQAPDNRPLWKRAFVPTAKWTGTLATAAVVTAVTTVVSVLVTQHVAASPAPPPTPTLTSSAPARHGPPVQIESVAVLRDSVQAGIYAFQRPLVLSPSDLNTIRQLTLGTPSYDDWFRSRGGVDPGWLNVQLVVEGNASQPSRITNITMIKSCTAPLSGMLFNNPPAGNAGDILINFNLDSPLSVAQTPDGEDYFSHYTIDLQPGEVQVLQIKASTVRHYCQFSLQLTVLVGAHQTIETVTDNGKPFQVTSIQNYSSYSVMYIDGVQGPLGRVNPKTYKD